MRPSPRMGAPRRLAPVIEAAGGVVWRRGSKGGLKVLLVHRERYDDWSFPKGKLDPGETHRHAALREVEEETGLRCKTGEELPETRYEDRKGRPKRVRYWTMQVVDGSFTPNAEVDEVRWLSLAEARDLLTYAHDVEVLDGLGELPRAG